MLKWFYRMITNFYRRSHGMDKLELLVSRHKRLIRKEKYKKANKKLDIIFVQACYYVVNEYLGLKDQFKNVSENISFSDFCSGYLETVEEKDRQFAGIIRGYLFHESVYTMETKCSKDCMHKTAFRIYVTSRFLLLEELWHYTSKKYGGILIELDRKKRYFHEFLESRYYVRWIRAALFFSFIRNLEMDFEGKETYFLHMDYRTFPYERKDIKKGLILEMDSEGIEISTDILEFGSASLAEDYKNRISSILPSNISYTYKYDILPEIPSVLYMHRKFLFNEHFFEDLKQFDGRELAKLENHLECKLKNLFETVVVDCGKIRHELEREDFFPKYVSKLLYDLYHNGVTKKKGLYQYSLELDAYMNSYVDEEETLRLEINGTKLCLAAFPFEGKQLAFTDISKRVLEKTGLVPFVDDYSIYYDPVENATGISASLELWSARDIINRNHFTNDELELIAERIEGAVDNIIIDCRLIRAIGDELSLYGSLNFLHNVLE